MSVTRRLSRFSAIALAAFVGLGMMPAATLAASSPLGDVAAAWPTWTDYTYANGDAIADAEGEAGISPPNIDIASGLGEGKQSVYVAFDGLNAFFRFRMKGNPVDSTKGGFDNAFWLIQIATAADDTVRAVVGLFGKSTTTDFVYVASSTATTVTSIYATPFSAESAGARSTLTEDGQYFLDFQVPISRISAVSSGAITASTPIKLFFGSSTAANEATINKDYMTGSAVYFGNLKAITLLPPHPTTVSTVCTPAGDVSYGTVKTCTVTVTDTATTVTPTPPTGTLELSTVNAVPTTCVLAAATSSSSTCEFTATTDGTPNGAIGAEYRGDVTHAPSTSNQAFTVNPAPLSVTANDASRLVGDPEPTFGATYSGFVLDQSLSALGGTLSCTTTATSASPAGTYPIVCSGLTSSHYAISYPAGTLTVTSSAASPDLTVTFDVAGPYAANELPSYTLSYTGVPDATHLTVTIHDQDWNLVSSDEWQTDDLTHQLAGLSTGTYTLIANVYDASGERDSFQVEFDVTPGPPTATIRTDPASGPYYAGSPLEADLAFTDFDPDSCWIAIYPSGSVERLHLLTLTVPSCTSALPELAPGEYRIEGGGERADGPSSVLAAPVGFRVVPSVPVAITLDPSGGEYAVGQNVTASLTYMDFELATCSMTVRNLNGTVVLTDGELPCSIDLSGLPAAGYLIYGTATDANDATTDAAMVFVQIGPRTVGGTMAITLDPTAGPYPVGQELVAQAAFEAFEPIRCRITVKDAGGQAVLRVKAGSAEACNVDLAGLHAGTYSIESFAWDITNETRFAEPVTVSLVRADVTVTADGSSAVYGGPIPTLTAVASGLRPSDTLAGLGIACSTNATSASHTGSYPITCVGPESTADYAFTYVPAQLTVGRAALTLTADDQQRTTTGTAPTFTVTPSGLVNGDTVASVGITADCTSAGMSSGTVGEYPISCTGPASTTDYDVSYVDGTLRVVADETTPVDTTPPAVTNLRTGFIVGRTVSLAGAVPLRTTWRTADAGGHVTSALQRRVELGSYATVATATIERCAFDAPLVADDTTYRHRVRAVDAAGNVSWLVGRAFRMRIHQSDGVPAVTRDAPWTRVVDRDDLGGASHRTAVAGSVMTIRTSTNGIAIVAARAPDRGRFQVVVDGVPGEVVDLYRSATLDRTVVWSRQFPAAGEHTVSVVTLDAPGPSSSNAMVAIDAFVAMRP